jgi:ribosomal protein S18 acetylase RimI-like enzyme
VVTAAGFEPVRRFLEVARPTASPVPELPAPAGVELVPWRAALDEPARQCHVEAFADHWGSEPRTAEEWAQWYTGHRCFRPDLSVLAVDPSSGEVASLVLCAAYPQDWATLPVEAWVNTVGTRRAWRGKGVARWLLADALRRIAAADTGFERAVLGVDAENPTGALRLYRDLGFDEDVRAVTTFSRPSTACDGRCRA